jgi:hypothetical protein
MNQPKERKYIDIDGNVRHIRLIRELSPLWLVPWHIKLPMSTASIWDLEGSQVQIPDDIWRNHGYSGKKWKAPVRVICDY